ncbi:unnamed protein product [Clonostachys rosea]|uniref:Beta-lactamase-related domain-containing protein n=1 Tax=Bionectria ochroleuca TaxID=29856 RepID=A0ABY6UEA8_BIOOC|nr:unnamed protein product [Clonostachys rosea]
MASESEIVRRLEKTGPIIDQIRCISGNAGLSLGVMHQGKAIYRANYGYRDVGAKLAMDCDTVVPIASITKAMIASALASFVDRGKLSWDTKLSELVPEFRSKTDEIKCTELVTEATLTDLLTHRLGLTGGNYFWSQKNQQVLVDKSETARILGSLQPIAPFRSKFIYHNWAYGLAGEILEGLAGESLEEHCQRTLFQPLELHRTTLAHPKDEHYAKCYMALSDATTWEVPPTAYTSEKARAGAGACKSTVNDLLAFYGAWMEAAEDQNRSGNTSSPDSPFHRIRDLWAPHATINNESKYGLGWVLTQLPAKAGLVGVNSYECPGEYPVVAKGTEPQRLIYHQGSVVGALSAVYLLPECQSAVIVLGNSFDLCDTPDWVSQLLIETLVDSPERNDYVELAQRTSANALTHHQLTIDRLAREQEKETNIKPLDVYCGRYYNKLGDFYLEITRHGDHGLRMAVQGFENASYFLQHYHHDEFYWPCDRDAESKEALYPQSSIGLHKVYFSPDADGKIRRCNWQIDKDIPEGEVFEKSEGK